jgi:hypothetical protein
VVDRIYIGIDNGCSGSVAILNKELTICRYVETPSKKEQSYTKTKQMISRIDYVALKDMLITYKDNAIAIIERPLVNPGMFKATISAVRALEATLIVVEELGIAVQYIDSREWQRALLPQGTKGSTELKRASRDIGCRLFPQHAGIINKHKDADGLLIAEYWRRNKS